MDYRRLKPYHGLLLFAVVIAALVFIATPLQYNFGIIGVALTELMLLALTAAAFFITRPHFGQTFPLRLPPVREFFGGAFIYAGTYLLMIPPLLLTQYFFPQINDTADSLAKLGTSVPPALTILIIAVMPAICEETLHRGYILSSLKPIKNTALIVLINGLIFGIFHLDPFRFLPTMMLGCAFAYIALKTESMVLTMLFHFINNLLDVHHAVERRAEDASGDAARVRDRGRIDLRRDRGSAAFRWRVYAPPDRAESHGYRGGGDRRNRHFGHWCYHYRLFLDNDRLQFKRHI